MVQSLAAMLMVTVAASQASVDDMGLLQRSSVNLHHNHQAGDKKGGHNHHNHHCPTSSNICRNPEQSSNLCLAGRPGWSSTGPSHQPHQHQHGKKSSSNVVCADHGQYCTDSYWGRDMLDCCPSVCNGQGVSITQSPASVEAHIDLEAKDVQVYHASILHFIGNPWEESCVRSVKTNEDLETTSHTKPDGEIILPYTFQAGEECLSEMLEERANAVRKAGDYISVATDEEKTYEFFEDGYLMVEEGKVTGRGDWSSLDPSLQDGAFEYPGRLIVPGFVDTHIHAPQTEIIAAFGASLIPWLEKYTFPAESKYSDTVHAKARAEVFVQELLRAGTTTALAFSTRHMDAADALFETFTEYNMLHISGKVLMDDPVNAPASLRDDNATSSIQETRDLIDKWHNVGRNLYAITPRFAPTSTLHQMNLTGELMKERPDVYMHTHLSESMGEINWVNWQFSGPSVGADAERHIGADSTNPYGATDHNGNPGVLDGYLSVYDHFGMLGPKSIFAHSIHLSQREWERLEETQSTVSFCPTSNNFLGSGLFNAAQAVKHKVRFGMGTDVGAGTSFSMLRTMGDGYKALKLGESWLKNVDPFLGNLDCSQGVPREGTWPTNPADWPECGVPSNDVVLSAAKAFYTATMGGAKQLSLDHRIGNFENDKEADFVVLNYGGGREFVGDRMSDAFLNAKDEPKAKLMEKLFVMMMMGDDRHVEATYVFGDRVYSQ